MLVTWSYSFSCWEHQARVWDISVDWVVLQPYVGVSSDVMIDVVHFAAEETSVPDQSSKTFSLPNHKSYPQSGMYLRCKCCCGYPHPRRSVHCYVFRQDHTIIWRTWAVDSCIAFNGNIIHDQKCFNRYNRKKIFSYLSCLSTGYMLRFYVFMLSCVSRGLATGCLCLGSLNIGYVYRYDPKTWQKGSPGVTPNCRAT